MVWPNAKLWQTHVYVKEENYGIWNDTSQGNLFKLSIYNQKEIRLHKVSVLPDTVACRKTRCSTCRNQKISCSFNASWVITIISVGSERSQSLQ